jgi:hypothetical protein
VQCITGDVLRATGFRPDVPSLSIVLARGEAARLTGGHLPLGFRMRQYYRLIEDREAPARRRWRVVVIDYAYVFARRDTDQELLVFHWHPHVADKAFPHVHLETGLGLHRDLVGIHVPTGEMALEDVIRFAIEELRVRPRVAGWAAILERSRAQTQNQM